MLDSSPSPHASGTGPRFSKALNAWCRQRGIRNETLVEAGCWFSSSNPNTFGVTYEQLNGDPARRVFHVTGTDIAEVKTQKLWDKGSKAKGAVWYPINKHRVGTDHTLLLCEGESDALSAIEAGCPFTVGCLPGAAMFHMKLRKIWFERQFDRVIVCFDNDEAGRRGASSIGNNEIVENTVPVTLLTPPQEGWDLNLWLKGGTGAVSPCDWSRLEESLETVAPMEIPRPELHPAPVTFALAGARGRIKLQNQKPDLRQAWKALCRPLPNRPGRNVKGARLQEAYCPLHEDGNTPAAWVGANRWGCWACDVQGDVYELVAWTQGIVAPGVKLTGESFKEAKARTEELLS